MTKRTIAVKNNMKNRDDLPKLLNDMGLNGIGVEVGVCQGEFLKHLAANWNGAKLFGVDAWRHFPGIDDLNNGDHNTQLDNIARTFMSIYNYGSKVVLVRDLSSSAASLFLDNSLDFVYIDAGHDYDSIKQDIEAWYPKVKNGGLLLGHDYYNGTIFFRTDKGDFPTHCSVKQVVDEFVALNKLTLNVTEEEHAPTWWIEVTRPTLY